MSRRTAESNKAVAAAWKNEKQRVSEGKGTRDWTPEQQQDILDRGKAYDENGKAFEGQHMRSVEMHPEAQADPNNIQFLTKAEHLEAHDGAWTNPTNWFYDPVTKTKTDFGDGPIIPCIVFKLSDPVVSVEALTDAQSDDIQKKEPEEKKNTGTDPPKSEHSTDKHKVNRKGAPSRTTKHMRSRGSAFKRAGKRIANGAKEAALFCVDHKKEIGTVAAVVVGGIIKIAADSTSEGSGGGSQNGYRSSNAYESDNVYTENKNYPETHSSPREHVVPGHGQRYNTNEGRVWIEKDPYPRGGKKKNKNIE